MESTTRFFLPLKGSFFLFGARGTGKSTWTRVTWQEVKAHDDGGLTGRIRLVTLLQWHSGRRRRPRSRSTAMDALLSRAARDHGVSRAEFIRQQLDLVLEQCRRHPRPRIAGIIRHPLPERGDEEELFGRRRR